MIVPNSSGPADVFLALASVASGVFNSIWGWVVVSLGVFLGFILVQYVISLFKFGVKKDGPKSPYFETQEQISKQFPAMGDYKGDL